MQPNDIALCNLRKPSVYEIAKTAARMSLGNNSHSGTKDERPEWLGRLICRVTPKFRNRVTCLPGYRLADAFPTILLLHQKANLYAYAMDLEKNLQQLFHPKYELEANQQLVRHYKDRGFRQ